MKKVLLFFSFVFISAYFIIWNWYGLNINYPANKKLHYKFELKNQNTSHQNSIFITLKGRLGLTYLEKDQGLLLEFEQVRGLYGKEDDKNKIKDFLSKKIKRPILLRKQNGGFLKVLYPSTIIEDQLAHRLFQQIIYYLTFPLPKKSQIEISHKGPFGPSYLTYKKEGGLAFSIKKRSPFQGSEIDTGKFKTLFSSLGYIKKLTGSDEDFKSEGNRVLSKSKMELSFELLSIQDNYQVDLKKIIPNSISSQN